MDPSHFVQFSKTLWNTHADHTWSNEFIEKITGAAKLGFFYLEIPSECKKFIPEETEFANNFHNDPAFNKMLRKHDFIRYVEREENQCQSLYIDRSGWNLKYLPENFMTIAKKMNQLCIEILKTFLRLFAIDEKLFDLVSGGATSDKGCSNFAFHHYSAKMTKEGLPPHKDMGHLTLLFNNKFGLQFVRNERWVNATPLQSHFVVIIGKTLENLINSPNTLRAAIHRVLRCTENRISFLVQIANDLNSPVYKREGSELVISHPSFSEYIDEN